MQINVYYCFALIGAIVSAWYWHHSFNDAEKRLKRWAHRYRSVRRALRQSGIEVKVKLARKGLSC